MSHSWSPDPSETIRRPGNEKHSAQKIIEAPSSANNQNKERDPDAHQVKKDYTWHFGYKVHIGVYKESGLAHTVELTGANVHDVTMVPELLFGTVEAVYGDSGYLGPEKREDAIIKNLVEKN